jgi:uncharacterized circularly permuted ATP-grasp superfamily protein
MSYYDNHPGLQRVDVIYRRVDDEFIDPLVIKNSVLGTPGLFKPI